MGLLKLYLYTIEILLLISDFTSKIVYDKEYYHNIYIYIEN